MCIRDSLGTGPVSTGLWAWPAQGPVGVQMAGGELVEVLGELHLPTQDVAFTGGTLLADADDRLQQLTDRGRVSDGVPGHRGARCDHCLLYTSRCV